MISNTRFKAFKTDIASAETLNKQFYFDTQTFEKSKEKLFAHSWQFIGDRSMIRPDCNLIPFTFLAGFLDEPLVLSVQKDKPLICLSNVCTHRGNILVNKPCKADKIRCSYHGRLFECDGKFSSMPEFKEVKNFPRKSDSLPAARIHEWMGLLFVSLTGKWPAKTVFSPLEKYLCFLSAKKLIMHPPLSRDYELNAHWSLYCENYLEGFHIPYVHPGLNRLIDYGTYTTELFPFAILQKGPAKGQTRTFDLPEGHPDAGQQVAAYYFFLFPNLMLNFYPWGLSVNIVRQLNIQKTVISYITYLFEGESPEPARMLDNVEMEDEEVVLNVQRGVRSRFYKTGRYSVNREQGVHHFHRLIAKHFSV